MTAAEYRAWAIEWTRSLDTLELSLRTVENKTGCADDLPRRRVQCARILASSPSACTSPGVRRRCSRACSICGAPAMAAPSTVAVSGSCSLVVTRHIAKTGGVSVRDWMLELEEAGRGRFFGPVTWMRYRGRCDGNKKFLHCCDPSDPRPVTTCRQLKVTEARAAALRELARGDVAAREPPRSLTMFEFHWPDSAMGRWGDPHTFLQMLPHMRPEVLPACRVVVTTVLRDPHTLYLSLQRHQYDAMREYGRGALRERCACNLTACDVLGFIAAFPNFQSWRLTSPRWLYPPLSHVGHDDMYSAASRLLWRFDVVGVFERLDEWLAVVCERAAIAPCAALPHLNAKHGTHKTNGCPPPAADAVAAAVHRHARADVDLHSLARERFEMEHPARGQTRASFRQHRQVRRFGRARRAVGAGGDSSQGR